jgi:anhydro-N-acetylmuramic acid kinase
MSVGQRFLSIGTMSGTSMDGVDVALIETDGFYDIREIANISFDYPLEFKLHLKAAEYLVRQRLGDMQGIEKVLVKDFLKDYLKNFLQMTAEKIAEKTPQIPPINFQDIIHQLTVYHQQAIQLLLEKIKEKKLNIDVIGFHGQTLYHQPHRKITIQVGDGAWLARTLNIKVVHDFRSRDVSMGGQGAPFAPLYHQALAVRDKVYPVGVINCGGIANISLIQGPHPADLLGFDTGPGNGLIDLWVKRHTHFKEVMDIDGQYGFQGKVNEIVLQKLHEKSILINHKNYFEMPFPKSLDINDLKLIPALETLSFEDACRTLEAFTADTIVSSIERLSKTKPPLLVLAGGGWYNPVIKAEFEARVHQRLGESVQVKTVDAIGWNSQAMEAQIFAYLAVRNLLNEPISFPETTGVPVPLCGGTVCLVDNK